MFKIPHSFQAHPRGQQLMITDRDGIDEAQSTGRWIKGDSQEIEK